MTPAEAVWVREHVWPDWLDVGPAMTTCACSVCGYCAQGRHADCYLVRHPAEHLARYIARGVPATWIWKPGGRGDPTLTAVYDVHHAHGAWCTCHRDGHPGRTDQPTLFDYQEATP